MHDVNASILYQCNKYYMYPCLPVTMFTRDHRENFTVKAFNMLRKLNGGIRVLLYGNLARCILPLIITVMFLEAHLF
jgi:hypothetical protein